MPMRLDDGWNQIQFNLSDFTRRAYGTNYIETLRVQVKNKDVYYKRKKKDFFVFVFSRFMQIVVFDVFTSRIDFIQKMNCRRNLNYIYRYVLNQNMSYFFYLINSFSFYIFLGSKEIIINFSYIHFFLFSIFFLEDKNKNLYKPLENHFCFFS